MGATVVGATRVDSNVANYLRGICGDGARTEGWEIVAAPGDVHILRARIVVRADVLLTVIGNLLPHTQGFNATLAHSAMEPGAMVITADLMVNVNTLLAADMPEPDNTENKE